MNPGYLRALEDIRAQEAEVQRLSIGYAVNGGLVWAIALGVARNRLVNLQMQLNAISPTVRLPEYAAYEYKEVRFESHASRVASAEVVDQATGRTLWSRTFDISLESQFTIRAGVDQKDKSRPPPSEGSLYSEEGLREALETQTRRRLFDALSGQLSNFRVTSALYHQDLDSSYAVVRRSEDLLLNRDGLIDGTQEGDEAWLRRIATTSPASLPERSPRTVAAYRVTPAVSAQPSERRLASKAATVPAESSVADVIESVQRSVVSIEGYRGFGSGFLIRPGDRVITNAHVIGPGTDVVIIRTPAGGVHVGHVIARNRTRDLALLSAAGIAGPFIELRTADGVRIGQEVIAVGNPRGLSFSATRGIVSQFRSVGGTELIQHDAAINPGSSGGPLLDPRGRALGINTVKLMESEGLGFAVTSGEIEEFLGTVPEEPLTLEPGSDFRLDASRISE